MPDKARRQAAIRRLVRTGQATTQAQLRAALRRLGLAADQSTLSRDLAELHIRKVEGRYRLESTNGPSPNGSPTDLAAQVLGYRTCGPHLVVMRTSTGAAQGIAVRIDRAADPCIIATLAGDDTLFLATATRRSQAVALRRLADWFGDKHGK
jgi:transcriptional regulator of arginine metabolism